jgi:protein-tyrosine phosphatase
LIDLHSHVLPGLDDGSETLAEAAEMCRAAQADGITVLAATPHVRHDYPTTPDAMEAALARVREVARGTVTVVPGGELDLAELDRPPAELARFALAGNPGYLLVETPYRGWPLDIGQRLARLRALGMTPVLAHPERNDEVQRRPELLEPLVASGALGQLTAASLDGRVGKRARECAFDLLDRGLAHLVASDAHHPSVRAIGMSDAAAAVGDEALARWLTEAVPRSIVERTTTPPRPEQVRPRRRRWFLIR